ncbi:MULTISPECIES: YsnF/AvaK domain-containing protein [unclassified Caballeronia]|uniref:YsnF/AvaK domain-containing protein n=1 Tax=unclassified Caballeronia TaxID=2646786 RepID=UPI00286319EF|nr:MULTISPECIES: YsnF/AvaK domain-containing protein [unclassified Caballeronia]MDR5741344.1 YsnF/AvaK domain-containing protein [Caballeronia sp. LZ016]MDR5807241.1 YsnF/AvaK domain-containing protein [Caballeronia sp. LZ019]
MTQTIIGVFNTIQDAEIAQARLEAEGISRSDMSVHAQNATNTTGADLGTRDVTTDTSDAGYHEGAMGRIEHFFKNLFGDNDRPEEIGHYQEAVRRGGALLTIDIANESDTERVRDALYAAGAIDIDARVAQWRNTGYTGYDSSAPAYTADEIDAERKAFPVVQESLEVGKREVQTGGVRVYSRLTETPVSESVNLREEHASIERRAVDRPATAADLKEGFVEIRETAEQPVVAKTARVVEEVVVGKESSNRTETITDTVRGTEVEVERTTGVEGTGVGTRVEGGADVPPVKKTPL